MANNDDYLTVEEAKVDLRIDDANGFQDADLERLSGPCARNCGRSHRENSSRPETVDAADVDPGLKALMLGRDGNALGRFVRRFRLPSMRWPPHTETIFSP